MTPSNKDLEPELLDNVVFWGGLRFGFYSSMVSMSLFLKNGPCFILPSDGPLAGIFTWKFLLLLVSLPCQVNMKILSLYTLGYFFSSSACICTLSLLLALLSLYQAVGCWKTLLRIISSYPALILLPIFTCFTFGSYKDGEDGLALSWKWTTVNMLVSFFWCTLRMLLQVEVWETTVLHSWILNPKSTYTNELLLYNVLANNCWAILFTALLFFSKLQYGVLLPSDPESAHVLQAGAVVPLVAPEQPMITLSNLRRMVGGTLVLALIAAVLYIWDGYASQSCPNFCLSRQ